MKYRILLLLALFCAIPAAAAGGTFASYSYEAAFSLHIESGPGANSMDLQAQADPLPESAQQTPEEGRQTPPLETPAQQTPEVTPGDANAGETQEPQPAQTEATDASPDETPDAARAEAATLEDHSLAGGDSPSI